MCEADSATSVVKRLIDMSVAIPVLILISPVLAIAAILILATMGPPVLFRQVRPGLNEKPFTLIKLRTMRSELDQEGHPLPDADRVSGLGRFLRKFSLDEFPQLWNVLRGEMSLVGPRPLLPEYLPRYTERQHRRHRVRPGITGWAQVNGRNSIAWNDKLALDVWYVDHWSVLLDAKILVCTLQNLLLRTGISHPDHATMPKFEGGGEGDI